MIEIRNLTLKYGDSVVVDRLDLTVQRGEALVLLGASGCGKTSAMRCIAGLEQPTTGSIVMDGVAVFDSERGINVKPHKRNVGMVFQSYAIWPHKTVFQNVAFSLQMKKLPRDQIRQRVDEALSLVGMSEMADRGASLLSGGQMQRVALARSIVMEPAVLLLDEPLSNLDARLRDRLRVELRELQQRLQMTWVYVTHDQDEAFTLADQVAVMEDGRIVQSGTPHHIYNRPDSASIAEFVGVDNVLACTVVTTDLGQATARFGSGDGQLRGVARGGCAHDDMRACIRAEDIRLVGVDQACGSDENAWSGSVVLATLDRGMSRYRVTLDDGPTLSIARPIAESRFEAGDRVKAVAPLTTVSIVRARTTS